MEKYDIETAKKSLMDSASTGNYEKMSHLLQSGITDDSKEIHKGLFYSSKYYVTPLYLAAANGHARCVKLLIDHGADVNAKDCFNVTALHTASFKGHLLCVELLLKAKAKPSVPLKLSSHVPMKSSNFGYEIMPQLSGTTPLHLASAKNHVDCVRILIRFGADINAVDEKGRTSLYIAAESGFQHCVLTHLKHCEGRQILSLPSLTTSDTPLHFAVSYGMVDCVEELLHLGSDVSHQNLKGLSPLHLAVINSYPSSSDQMKILQLLISRGYNVDINQPDVYGYRPLHYASFEDKFDKFRRIPEIAKFLIAHGADVDIDYHKMYTLLEQELHFPEKNFDILKYMVQSMLHLPHLETLNIIRLSETDTETSTPYLRIYHSRSIRVDRARIQREPLPLGLNDLVDLDDEILIPFREDTSHGNNNPSHVSEDTDREDDEASLLWKKQQWYGKMASSPRSLMQYCRYAIRGMLTPYRLKYVEKLPVPPVLQSYLMFGFDK